MCGTEVGRDALGAELTATSVGKGATGIRDLRSRGRGREEVVVVIEDGDRGPAARTTAKEEAEAGAALESDERRGTARGGTGTMPEPAPDG